MNVLADYHTHSRYSRWYHAKHNVDQMTAEAKRLGLKQIAITDHGPKHTMFGIKSKNIDKAKSDCLRATKKYNMPVFFGIEANIIGGDGTIDLTAEQLSKLDILLMGYHKGTKCDFIKYFDKKNRNTPEQILKNTNAYVNAINKYNINIITHLNEYIKVDTKLVAKAAKARGTIIELNAKHLKLTDTDVKILLDSGVDFVVSSDAHSKNRIADVQNCLDFIVKHNIPIDRVKNIDNLAGFTKK